MGARYFPCIQYSIVQRQLSLQDYGDKSTNTDTNTNANTNTNTNSNANANANANANVNANSNANSNSSATGNKNTNTNTEDATRNTNTDTSQKFMLVMLCYFDTNQLATISEDKVKPYEKIFGVTTPQYSRVILYS